MDIIRQLEEATPPHPMYGKFKKWATVKRHGPRVALVFDSRQGSWHVWISGSDTGELFIWETVENQEGIRDLRTFRKVKKALKYLRDRYNIRLNSMKDALRLEDYSKMPKWMRKQYV